MAELVLTDAQVLDAYSQRELYGHDLNLPGTSALYSHLVQQVDLYGMEDDIALLEEYRNGVLEGLSETADGRALRLEYYNEQNNTGRWGDNPRDPDDNVLPAYDCPTGTCGKDMACEDVPETQETMDPFSRAHIERNYCNLCPTSPPTFNPKKISDDISDQDLIDTLNDLAEMGLEYNANTLAAMIPDNKWAVVGRVNNIYIETATFDDATNRKWLPDAAWTAPEYHGDIGWLHRDNRDADFTTFRLVQGKGEERGFQCRFYDGKLDDRSIDMGTYDYRDAPMSSKLKAIWQFVTNTGHIGMDVTPHEANGNYVKDATPTYENQPLPRS